jgi:plastocyanin
MATRRTRGPAAFLLVTALLMATSCTKSVSVGPGENLPLKIQPDNPDQPYGITAIDYHFHDAHPTFPLGMTRTVVFTNQGLVKHNVTIPGTTINKDLRPGQGLVVQNIGQLLGGPGYYAFYCDLHVVQGMAGVIVIQGAPPPSQATP